MEFGEKTFLPAKQAIEILERISEQISQWEQTEFCPC